MNLFHSIDPATEDIIFEHHVTAYSEIDVCINKALENKMVWQQTTVEQRIGFVHAFQTLLKKNKDDIATCISMETGKPLWESLQEVNAVVGKVDISIDSFLECCQEKNFNFNQKEYSLFYKPIGLMAVLGPFNFPAHLPHGHIIPAILAGNLVLFKPSEYTTEVAKKCIKLWYEAGLPEYVLQLILGDGNVGEQLYQHKDIDGVLFTGGYKTGKKISTYLGSFPEKLLALELGGNNPLVISKHSYNQDVFDAIVQSAFLTSGQRCTCARRLIVVDCEDKVTFETELQKKIFSLKVGAYTDIDEPFMGPVIHKQSQDYIVKKYSSLLNHGAKEIVPQKKLFDNGYFLSPSVLDVSHVKELDDDECFGPFLKLMYVSSFNEAILEANNTNYGLSASLFSSDSEEHKLFFQQVKAGIINFNSPTNGASSKLPFGGVGYSGNYRPSAYFAANYCSYPIASVKSL